MVGHGPDLYTDDTMPVTLGQDPVWPLKVQHHM
jgi:hypothetical protein